MLQAWRHVAALRDPEAWDAWLYRLTVRACYRQARRGAGKDVIALDLTADRPAPGPDFAGRWSSASGSWRRSSGAAARPAGGDRPALLPRPAADPGGGRARRPGRHGEVPPPPRRSRALRVTPRRRPGARRLGDAGATGMSTSTDRAFERTLVERDDRGRRPAAGAAARRRSSGRRRVCVRCPRRGAPRRADRWCCRRGSSSGSRAAGSCSSLRRCCSSARRSSRAPCCARRSRRRTPGPAGAATRRGPGSPSPARPACRGSGGRSAPRADRCDARHRRRPRDRLEPRRDAARPRSADGRRAVERADRRRHRPARDRRDARVRRGRRRVRPRASTRRRRGGLDDGGPRRTGRSTSPSPTGRSTWPRATAALRRSTPRDGSPRWQAALGGLGGPDRRASRCRATSSLVTTNDARLVALRRDSGDGGVERADRRAAGAGVPVAADGLVWVGPGRRRRYRRRSARSGWPTARPRGRPTTRCSRPPWPATSRSRPARWASWRGATRRRASSAGAPRRAARCGRWRSSATRRSCCRSPSARSTGWTPPPARVAGSSPLDSRPGCCLAVAQGVLAVGTDQRHPHRVRERAAARRGCVAVADRRARRRTASPVRGERGSRRRGLATVPLEVTTRYDRVGAGHRRPLGAAMSEAGDIYVSDTLAPRHPHRARRDGCRTVGRHGSRPRASSTSGRSRAARTPAGRSPSGRTGSSTSRTPTTTASRCSRRMASFVRAFGRLGSAPGQFTIPFDLSVDDDGNVYVTRRRRGADHQVRARRHAALDRRRDDRPAAAGPPAHRGVRQRRAGSSSPSTTRATILRLDPATGRVLEALPGGGCESVVDPWDRIWVLDCSPRS